jgi:hypothetical protein
MSHANSNPQVDGTGKLAELEKAEREKMRAKVDRIKAHGINCLYVTGYKVTC